MLQNPGSQESHKQHQNQTVKSKKETGLISVHKILERCLKSFDQVCIKNTKKQSI